LEPSTSPSDSTGAICSDDTSWRYDRKSSKHCGWVYFSPDNHCSKLSEDGIPASEACPIACGDRRTNSCDIPKCNDDSWFSNIGKSCNGHLHQGVSAKGRCRNVGVVTTLGNDQKSFAYEYCSKCSRQGSACVPTLSPTSSPTTSPTSNPTSSLTTSPTLNPTTSPTENSYDMFVTTDELKDAVDDYCGDPEAWTTNSKYAKYGPIEEWDVSSITKMAEIFYEQSNCNPNIADWDVSAVKNFRNMFAYASFFNQDIGGWDVSKGTYFNNMFRSASSFNQDIGRWDVSKGTNFFAMFNKASLFNQDLCDWDIDDSAYTTYTFCSGAISCGACSF